MDDYHRFKCFTSKQLYHASTLLHSLLCAVNLSFPEMCCYIEGPLNKVVPRLYDEFIARYCLVSQLLQFLTKNCQLLAVVAVLDHRLGIKLATADMKLR